MSLHLAQLSYLAGLVVVFGGSPILTSFRLSRLCSNFKVFLGYLIVFSLCMYYGTVEHPFLLADNRHISFYVWRRLLKHQVFRCCILPVGLAVTWAATDLHETFFNSWDLRHSMRFCTVSCSLVVLILSPLLELRYFNLSLILILLETIFPRCHLMTLRQTENIGKKFEDGNNCFPESEVINERQLPPVASKLKDKTSSGVLPQLLNDPAISILATVILSDIFMVFVFTSRTFSWPDGT
eukprot:Filipodium_phascolosomae@DN2830_c0_g1_i1.p1